jgi:hypothetical protein
MIETMQTIFGLTVPVTNFPLSPELASALAERLTAAALSVRENDSAALSADVRADAQQYLALRRERGLRLPFALQRACDESARAVMRMTVNAPPRTFRAERLVA